MGLFGSSKIRITPNNFVNTQLDNIFSENFINAEKKHLTTLSKEIPILQSLPLDEYVKQRRHVVYNLFRLAWDRTAPHSILILYSFIFIMLPDPRVKAINSGLYDMCIVHAQRVGIDTFEFMSRLFVGQIIPPDVSMSDADYSHLCELYQMDFTRRYKAFEALIKQHKFVHQQSDQVTRSRQ